MNFKNYISVLFLLMLTHASCGVFTKFGKHTQHEVKQHININDKLLMMNETTIKGDSVVHIESSFIQAVIPFNNDTCGHTIDSIVSDNVKLYLKPVYHFTDMGKKVFEGMQVQALTPAKTIKSNYTLTQHSSANLQSSTSQKIDSTHAENSVIKKRDNRLGGYTTIIIIVSLLGVGYYIAKKLFIIKTPL